MARAQSKTAPVITPEDAEALDALADVFWSDALAELQEQIGRDHKQTSNTIKEPKSAERAGPS
jgi:hypothetical protein